MKMGQSWDITVKKQHKLLKNGNNFLPDNFEDIISELRTFSMEKRLKRLKII